ncbi:type II toxin-antitoxin system RelE/ParE family toxin [Aliarcobacter skirrowii]|uniref:type II toxin-antitoxin system RelE/ParE family toxin n=1 Tax=Aliarcobacter skirrowii TaxID=28200 RepID=UPI0029AF444A|nr:type II toxin-antitoxin system RelE/ParE family toxin [Aliarcobacter skirrowii]MDX4057996.1 type II toxin-antitoxin system RelE/ParE family toxin [Aliarcobacter skirrowii]
MNIEYTDNFLKEAKQLSKKFKLLKQDLKELIQDITINKDFGTDLGSNLYKKRLKNSSIPTGKSGGFRVIIYYQVENSIILISIYSKTQKDSISDEEIEDIIKNYLKK